MTNISSGDIKAKEGDLVNLLCSAQGEPPITFSWEKDQKPLESFMEKDKPHRSSLLTVRMKDQTRLILGNIFVISEIDFKAQLIQFGSRNYKIQVYFAFSI